ncbi:hypothetical protein FOMPIDRAFT_93129 [Fomitopsis schrenkii]|uniref:Uncharacterized protein n=1 Tax=Fomitopsis schrenkii TaxID=2126942 RepID=S8DWU9_FOMSC|nr:hypothetical protein FOMPIDRAFT_93129 [Fomitopsis schrenkii]
MASHYLFVFVTQCRHPSQTIPVDGTGGPTSLDWKRHKRFCVAAEGVEPRPIMIDAILLPVDATHWQPRMIKLACAVQRDEDAELPEFDIVHRWEENVYFDREPSALRTFIPGGGPGFAALLARDRVPAS